MTRRILAPVAALWLLALVVPAAPAPAAPPADKVRKLLYPANIRDVPAALKPHVERLLAADQKPINPDDAKADGVFLRVISRQHALDGTKLKAGGWLGPRPFVFLTVPAAAYGRDLLGTFSAIGYDPEDILDTEAGVEKVAVVFAYPEKVRMCDSRDGTLPDD